MCTCSFQSCHNLFYSVLSLFSLFPDPKDHFRITDETRTLGLVVCRGTSVVLVCPADSLESIPNPFLQPETS